jgi:aspartate ammonia-lyase
MRLDSYIEALRRLQNAFFAKCKEFEHVLKMGRTHLQDAVPMSLDAEFHGWGTTIGEEVQRIHEARQLLREIKSRSDCNWNLGDGCQGRSRTRHQSS